MGTGTRKRRATARLHLGPDLADEDHLVELLKRLSGEGLECRALLS